METQQTVTCAATSYCMGCSSTATTGCTACFNWGTGKVGARKLSASTPFTCTTALSVKTTDCQVYTGMATNTGTSGTCSLCKSKTWRNEAMSAANVNTMTCSNTAINTTTCTKASEVANCEQMVCRDYASAGSTDYTKCGVCKKDYWGTVDATTGLYTACGKTGTAPITNCQVYYSTGTTNGCYVCKSKFAVKSTGASCVAFTKDSNCRQLQSDDINCSMCWAAYYWNATVCKLSAKVVSAVMMVALSMISFFMY